MPTDDNGMKCGLIVQSIFGNFSVSPLIFYSFSGA